MFKLETLLQPFTQRLTDRLESLYGHDRDLTFRARNLFSTAAMIVMVLTGLLSFFLFAGDRFVDAQTRQFFGWYIFALIGVLGACCRMTVTGHMRWARRIVFGLALGAVFVSVLTTGTFPHSQAYPALLIPVVLAFCIFGGRVGGLTALSIPALLLFQFTANSVLGIEFPDWSSSASPAANHAAVLWTTFLVTVFALFSYDRSNRWYIKKSKAAAEGKASFLANMSHEIRTPMNGVIGFSDVMLKTELDDRQKTFMEAIHSSGKSLLNIINDILDYSKIEAGRMEIIARPFNLKDLLEDIITLLSISAGPKDVSLDLYYPDEVPKVFVADAGRIRQVVMNLAGNAIKFTHDGRVMIKVHVRNEGGINKLRIDVHDTGIGIPADKIDTIFEQFTQAETSTTQRFGGTGLGLTITRRLVELMDGTITVRSEEGVGSIFSFEIDAPIAPTFKNAMTAASSDAPGPDKVLLLTSATEDLTDMAETLTRLGYRPHMAAICDKILPFMACEDFKKEWLPAVIVGISENDTNYQNVMRVLDQSPLLARLTRIGAHNNTAQIPPYDPRLHYIISPEITDTDLTDILSHAGQERSDFSLAG